MQGNSFLQDCNNHNLLIDMIPALDWLLGGELFSNSSWKNRVGTFTKHAKRAIEIKESNYILKGGLPYSKTMSRRKNPYIHMTSGDSEGRALLRHLRNSIAHGNARLYFLVDGKPMIEFLDFRSGTSVKRGSENQTAQIVLNADCLQRLHDIYKSLEKAQRTPKRRRKRYT